jgi:tetratricopeptide (TPR) repeat protein
VFGEFWSLWAEGSQSKKYHKKAAQEYMRALELDPQDAWSAIHLASSREQYDITIDQAIEYLERARSDRPDQDWVLRRLSVMYCWKKDYVKALEMALLARSKLPEELDLKRKRVKLKESIDKSIQRLKLLIEKGEEQSSQEL